MFETGACFLKEVIVLKGCRTEIGMRWSSQQWNRGKRLALVDL